MLHLFHYAIALGSNLGDRLGYLRQAASQIDEHGFEIVRTARIYENPPVGHATKMFLNTAVLAVSHQSPPEAMSTLLSIEQRLGRHRHSSDRVIDLDIISVWRSLDEDGLVYDEPNLSIPHTRARERNFVMLPLADMLPLGRFTANEPMFKDYASSFEHSEISAREDRWYEKTAPSVQLDAVHSLSTRD